MAQRDNMIRKFQTIKIKRLWKGKPGNRRKQIGFIWYGLYEFIDVFLSFDLEKQSLKSHSIMGQH